jgi:hypothetical protein
LNPEILEGLLGLGNCNYYINHSFQLAESIHSTDIFSLFFTVGGVMAFLTLYEMLPQAFEYAGRKDAVKAVFVGMAFMSMRCVMLLVKRIKKYSHISKLHVHERVQFD